MSNADLTRGIWDSKIGFIVAAVGSAIGLVSKKLNSRPMYKNFLDSEMKGLRIQN